ncbi:MAG TPA: DUF2059 domain-containing protein [Anaeromyxobacter sp.]|nr:DUF2059 domain-containing protein [Anaeromyxobacter sp.]
MPSRVSKVLAASIAAVLLAVPALAAAPDKPRHDDIRKLLVLTGAGQLGVQTAQQMMVSLRPLIPKAPESFWREFAARLDPDELVEMVVPIYAKHLSAQDVKDLIAFYQSPAGKHLTAAQPLILQESMAAGQAWGQKIAQDLVRTAKAQGFEVKNL